MTFKEDHSFVKRGIFVLIVLHGAEGFSGQLHGPPRRWYINYAIFDRQSPAYSDEEPLPPQDSVGSSFNQRDARKPIQYPQDVVSRVDGPRSENKFVFPDYSVEPRGAGMEKAPACKGSTFCEEVSGYPMDLVTEAMRSKKIRTDYKNVDMIESIGQRIDASDSESLCVSVERVVYPKAAETVDNQWLFIVNHPNFTQGVRVETCVEEGNGCKMIDGFAEGYVTSCRQKYIYRQLTAIVDDGSIGPQFFRFPASCCCHVEFQGTMSARFRAKRHQ